MTLPRQIIFLASALIIVLSPTALDPSQILAFTAPKMLILQTLALAGTSILLIHWLHTRHALDSERLPRVVKVLVIGWMAWVSATMIWSFLPQLSLVGNYYWQLGLFTKISLVSIAYLTFIASSDSGRSKFLYRLPILFSAPVLIYGLLQTIGINPIPWFTMGPIVFSTFGNPNYFAGYLVMLLPLTLAECWRGSNTAWRIICIIFLAAETICLIATDSRGGFFATAIAVALCLLWSWKFNAAQAKWSTAVWIVASIALTVIVSVGGESLGDVIRGMGFVKNIGSIETRQYTWETALRMIALRPQGWGLATFEITHMNYATTGFLTYAQKFLIPFGAIMDRTHNAWTEIGVELGVVGLIIWLGLLAVGGNTLINGIHNSSPPVIASEASDPERSEEERSNLIQRLEERLLRRSAPRNDIQLYLIGALAAMLGYILHLTVNPSEIGGEIIFWWLAGWALGASCQQPREENESKLAKIISFIVIAAMFGFSLFGFVYVRQFFR